MLLDLYRSIAFVFLFDGDGGAGAGDGGAGDGGAGAGDGGAGAGSAAGSGKTFTQDDVNRILADDKRKHQAALLKTEQTYKELLQNNKSLSEKERQTLQENLETISGQLRTKEEQAKIEKKQLEEALTGKIKEHETRASEWETRYKTETVARSLQDAAVSADAFQPNQIVALLKPHTRLVEDLDEKTGKSTGRFKSVVDFPDFDTEGNPITSTRTPGEAVKRMKELPAVYGNLFKSNVVSGVGSNNSVGSAGSGGKVDLSKLSQAQYMELREKNPELLGLAPKRGRR